jgi:nitroreductase
MLANLLALARAADLPARVVVGFADPQVSALLDVDPMHEGPVCLVALGSQEAAAPPAPEVRPLHLATVPLSEREVRYPLIEEAQAASSLATPHEAAAGRRRAQDLATAQAPGPVPAGSPEGLPTDPIERVIQRRGSTRRFARRPIPADAVTTLLEVAAAPVPIDAAFDGALLRAFLVVNAVDGLEPGTYATRPGGIGLEQLRAGEVRSEAEWAALRQELAADASVNLYWLADLDRVLGELGDRGYRAVQLEAAIRAGRCWLAAYALRLGATGLTFFDDEAIRLFAPASDGLDVMFLLAVGVPAARR